MLSRAVSMLQARIAGRVADQRALDPRPDGLGLARWTALRGDISNGDARTLVAVARTIVSHADTGDLQDRYGKHRELDHIGPVDRATALRLLCDCDVTRVITQGDSEILDLGRSTRVPSPALRKALIVRDRQCRYRGCDRPPKWCDAHHVTPWAPDGETNLENLVLVCRYHHGLIHKGRASVVGHEVIPNHLLDLVAGRAPP